MGIITSASVLLSIDAQCFDWTSEHIYVDDGKNDVVYFSLIEFELVMGDQIEDIDITSVQVIAIYDHVDFILRVRGKIMNGSS